MAKFKSSVAVYQDLFSLIKETFTEEIFKKYFERVSHSFPIDEEEVIQENEIASFYFKTNQRLNFLYDLSLTYSEKYLDENELTSFLYKLSLILKLYRKNDHAIKLLQQILDKNNKNEKSKDNKLFIANCNLQLADIYSAKAIWRGVDKHFKIARNLFEELEDKNGVAECEFVFGSVYLEKGDLYAASVRFENTEKFLDKKNNQLLWAKLTNNKGIYNSIKGNFEESKKYLEEALALFETLNLLPFQAEVKLNLGIIAFRQQKYDIAERNFEDAKILAIRSLSIQTVAIALMYKSQVYLSKGNLKTSLKIIEQSTAISYQINDTLTVADLFKLNGVALKELQRYDAAEDMLLTSLRINTELGNQLNFAETSQELGYLYKLMGKHDLAINHFTNAMKYFTKIEAKKEIKELSFEVNSLSYKEKFKE
ncbi:MAG: hypothetical protein Fur0015_10440 [Ignavibacteriales bacterium]